MVAQPREVLAEAGVRGRPLAALLAVGDEVVVHQNRERLVRSLRLARHKPAAAGERRKHRQRQRSKQNAPHRAFSMNTHKPSSPAETGRGKIVICFSL